MIHIISTINITYDTVIVACVFCTETRISLPFTAGEKVLEYQTAGKVWANANIQEKKCIIDIQGLQPLQNEFMIFEMKSPHQKFAVYGKVTMSWIKLG